MSPKEIIGTNMWELFPGELIEGKGGEIRGPAIVRVEEIEFGGETLTLVQLGHQKIEVVGKFPDVVKRENNK